MGGISSPISLSNSSANTSPKDKKEIDLNNVGISTNEMIKNFKKKHGLNERKKDKTHRIDVSKYAIGKRSNSLPMSMRSHRYVYDEFEKEEEKEPNNFK